MQITGEELEHKWMKLLGVLKWKAFRESFKQSRSDNVTNLKFLK